MATELAPTETEADAFTSADVDALTLPDGWRVEIIAGELFVSKGPGWRHQRASDQIVGALRAWSERSELGYASSGPGVIYTGVDNVIPDAVWISDERLQLDEADHLVGQGPELMVEVLSPGPANKRRDLEAKLALYSRRDVLEYWVVDPQAQTVEIYSRRGPEAPLELLEVLTDTATITSSLLPGFSLPISAVFARR